MYTCRLKYLQPSTFSIGTNKDLQFNPITLGAVLFLTLASSLLTGRAWQLSAPSPGTTLEADFWFLLQSCLMQIASLVPIFIELWTSSSGPVRPRLWSWFFAAGSLSCTIASPFLYVLVPTATSAVVSFCGSALLAFVLLEALAVADWSAGMKLKEA
jgi:hypothetical protein